MKNINKNLIFVAMIALVFGVAFGPMAHTALAAAPSPVASAATNVTTTSATLNGTVNPNGQATTAYFVFQATNYGTQNGLNGNAPIPMSYVLNGLTPNTAYSFTVQAINGSGMITSNVVNFTTASVTPPSISAVSASGITCSSATLNGSVNPNGSPTSGYFVFNSTNYDTTNGMNGNAAIPMTYNLSGLNPSTNYSFHMEAINAGGMTVGSNVAFATPACPSGPKPTVVTMSAINISSSSATLNGTVNPNGAATSAYFVFQANNYGTQNGLVGNAAIPMSYNLSGLAPSTTYSFRLEAINANGLTVGTTLSFTTAAGPSGPAPTVVTTAATNITATSATLNGTVNPNGSATSSYFVCSANNYGTQNGLVGNAPIAMTYSWIGLTPNTAYSCRLEGINANGLTAGNTINFTTLAVNPNAPIVTTISPATSITQTSATISGIVDPNGGGATTVNFMLNGSPVAACTQVINVPTTLNCNLSGLTLATTYTYFPTATNVNGTTNGTAFQFTTLNANGGGGGGGGSAPETPIVTTNAATNISGNYASINAFIDSNGYDTTHWFQYGTDQNDLSSTTNLIDQHLSSGVFTAKINDLAPSTTYYFRGAASSSEGTVYGSTLSFTTGSSSGPNVSGLNAATTIASAVTKTTAKLNGLVLNANNGTNSWFEYGTSVSLGQSTDIKSIADAAKSEMAADITGLNPNTIYFFQLKAKNSSGLVFGEMRVFRTASEAGNGTGNGTGTGTGTGEQALDLASIKIEATPTTVSPDDTVKYSVSYKNTSENKLQDVVVSVVLPADVIFADASAGNFSKDNNTLSADVGELIAGQAGTLTLSGKIAKGAVDKDVLVTTAAVNYTDSKTGGQGDALDYALVDVSAPNLLPAASIFGSGFLPGTLLGWMVLLLTALGLVMLGRKFYAETNWAKVTSSIGSIVKKDVPPTNLPQ